MLGDGEGFALLEKPQESVSVTGLVHDWRKDSLGEHSLSRLTFAERHLALLHEVVEHGEICLIPLSCILIFVNFKLKSFEALKNILDFLDALLWVCQQVLSIKVGSQQKMVQLFGFLFTFDTLRS